MKVRRIKILFLISCSILTVTACAKSKAESGASSPDQENSIKAEVTANHKQEELPLSQDMTSESSPTESAQVADENPSVNSSLFTPQKMSFEGNEFSNYLENTIQPENISCRIFGFHAPAEYTSDTSQDFLLSLEVLGNTDASYAAVSNKGTGYLYLFVLDKSADTIREYLKSDAWPTGCNFSSDNTYPILLTGDTVISTETKDSLDTIYGSCDILFSELETSLTDLDILSVKNPIYVESAYFSVKIAVTDTSFVTNDIAILYMYPPESSTPSEYQGYLKNLIPDMLTP